MGQSTICQMETESAADWDWNKQDDMWQIFWTALPPIANSLRSVAAQLNVVAGASVIDHLVSLVQLCVNEIVKARIYL